MSNRGQKATRKFENQKPPPNDAKKYMPFRAYKQRDIESKIADYVRSRRPEYPDPFKREPKIQSPRPKLSKKIQTNPLKQTQKKPNKKTKLDINSFPRVFSTSDLMDKMHESPHSARCTFQHQQTGNVDQQAKEMRNNMFKMQNTDVTDLNMEILRDFPSTMMVFNTKRRQEIEDRLSQTEIELECKNMDIKNLSNMLQEKTQDLVIKEQKEKILSQKLEQKEAQINKLRDENDASKREKTRYEKSVKELQRNIRALEDQLQRNNFKGYVKIGEYEKLRERIRELENEREALLVETNKLKRELKEKTDLVDSLSRRNDHLQKQNDLLNVTKKENRIYSLEYRVDALQDQVNRVKHENEKLKKTYTYTVNELAEYEMKQMKLREIIDKQKNSLKVLENTTSSESRTLQNYELENIRLREINRSLVSENDKFRMENQRLLKLVAMLPARQDPLAITSSKPPPIFMEQKNTLVPSNPKSVTIPPVHEDYPTTSKAPSPKRNPTENEDEKQDLKSLNSIQSTETPAVDEQQIAMYLVQTPGSTPKRARDALQEYHNFKTTIMQAFHRKRKAK